MLNLSFSSFFSWDNLKRFAAAAVVSHENCRRFISSCSEKLGQKISLNFFSGGKAWLLNHTGCKAWKANCLFVRQSQHSNSFSWRACGASKNFQNKRNKKCLKLKLESFSNPFKAANYPKATKTASLSVMEPNDPTLCSLKVEPKANSTNFHADLYPKRFWLIE